ncbi:MAG TPA: FAD-dependent oxidoreductase [Gemmatimonadaceae bacterium]|nr:FAD-dependent oxidoreductase [Gemmatimonadaceae bacterium]
MSELHDLSDHYDLIVIGAGPAGETAATKAAYFGKRVCIVERAPKPGGAAINTGTIPSKALRETALYFSGLRQHGLYGVQYSVKPNIGLGDFMFRERDAVEAAWMLAGERLHRKNIHSVQGVARFTGPRMIEITRFKQEPRRISADVFVVATGSSPIRPAAIPFDDAVVVDAESILRLPTMPSSLVVIGGGATACEYACSFGALGVPVTLLNTRARLLTQVDLELAEALRHQMTARFGVAVHNNVQVARVDVKDGIGHAILGDDTTFSASCLLHADGREGNTEGLGLELAGVRTGARGFIVVDEHLRSSVPHIYAAGEANGAAGRAPIAHEQGHMAVRHAYDLRYRERSAPVVPYAVYTIPEIACVGVTEEQARARKLVYEVGRASYRSTIRGQISGEVDGLLKILFNPADQRILGVGIIGDQAAELIHIGMTAMMFGATLDCFLRSVYDHPSLAEAYRLAAQDGVQRAAKRMSRTAGLPSQTGEFQKLKI